MLINKVCFGITVTFNGMTRFRVVREVRVKKQVVTTQCCVCRNEVFCMITPRIVDREITHIINDSYHVSEIYLIRVFLGTNFSCKPNPGYLDDVKILIEPIRIISAV